MFCKKLGIIFIVLITALVIFTNSSLAMSVTELAPIYTEETASFEGFGKELLGIIRNIAVISAVVILAFIGLKFMFGSIEQKAEYKKSLVPIAIGMFVVLGATTITGLVWDLQKIESEVGVGQHQHDYKEYNVVEKYTTDTQKYSIKKITTTYKCEECGDTKVTVDTVKLVK